MKPRKGRVAPTKRELWAAHTLWASGCEDQARLQKAVEELGIAEPKQRAATCPRREREGGIQDAILRALRLHPMVAAAWTVKVGAYEVNGRYITYGVVGHSDLAGYTKRGQAIFMEVKRPGQKMTDKQEAFIANALEAGCIAGCVHDVDEAMVLLSAAGVWR